MKVLKVHMYGAPREEIEAIYQTTPGKIQWAKNRSKIGQKGGLTKQQKHAKPRFSK